MKKLIASLVVVFVICAAANANLVSYTVSYNDSYTGDFNFNKVLNLHQFDSSLGTLLNVKLDYALSADGWLGYENKTNAGNKSVKTFINPTTDPENVTHGDILLNFGATTLSSVNWYLTDTYTFYTSVFDGTLDYAGTSGWSTVYLAKTGGGSITYDSGLDSFIGNGNVQLNLIGSAYMLLGTTGGNNVTKTITTGTGNVTITYEYVPEPATMSLLALGGLLLRRKK